jgi:hypothetical protein
MRNIDRLDTKRRTVLIIGMLDSIHLARWLSQFKGLNIDFYIYPSKKFKNLSGALEYLLSTQHGATYQLLSRTYFFRISGYLDYVRFEIPKIFRIGNVRRNFLARQLEKREFDYVHALEIQGAGYLISSVDKEKLRSAKVILTNWGSDIFYFQNQKEHLQRIKRSLSYSDFYSAECVRDYRLVSEIGFSGQFLPCMPNAGGFGPEYFSSKLESPSKRRQVLIKGYGGEFGRIKLMIPFLPSIMSKYPEYFFIFYSVTDDVLAELEKLPKEILSKITIHTRKKPLSHGQMIDEFQKSRIYIGFSASDGVSTSFLESLVSGCYPIQTDTSCANEWQQLGAIATIIPVDLDLLIEGLILALESDALVDSASVANKVVAEQFLRFDLLAKQARVFYGGDS